VRAEPVPAVRLTLPYPPTGNHSYATVGKRRVLTDRASRFRKVVASEVLAQRSRQLAGDVQVSITLHPPDRRRRDIDNPVKPLLDALTMAGVWSDDSQVRRLRVEFGERTPGGACVAEVGEL